MWCIARTKEERKAFIEFIKDLVAEGKKVLARWALGDFSVAYPYGLYAPSFPRRVEPLPYTFLATW